jgi:hypothetical protein
MFGSLIGRRRVQVTDTHENVTSLQAGMICGTASLHRLNHRALTVHFRKP